MNIKKSVLISLAFMSVTTTVYGKDISVRLNGNDIGTSAIIEDDRSFVPYRAVNWAIRRMERQKNYGEK